jgi:cell division protein FtsB
MAKYLECALSCLEFMSHFDLDMGENVKDVAVVRARIAELEVKAKKWKADYEILSDDYKQLQVDNERLNAELAVRERQAEILAEEGWSNGHTYEPLRARRLAKALAQARAELGEVKPEPKFKPGDEVTHVELDNPFIVTTCYWDNGMWWYTTGRTLVMAVGEPKLRLVDPKPEALRDEKPEVKP